MVFNLRKFDIQPSICPVEYECTSIQSFQTQIYCDDINFDGIFNGDATDGTATFSAGTAEYLSERYVAGEYLVTLTGRVIGSDSPVSATTTFKLVL